MRFINDNHEQIRFSMSRSSSDIGERNDIVAYSKHFSSDISCDVNGMTSLNVFVVTATGNTAEGGCEANESVRQRPE